MNKERERIIFLHDIPGGLDDENDIAKQLSKNHPELIIFSDPKPLTDPQVKMELMENSEANTYGPQDFFAGAHIYKNGVKYSLVRGINPYKDSVTIGNHIISLKLDKYGLLSGIDLRNQKAGARVEIDEEKKRLLNTLFTELNDLERSYGDCLKRNNEIISLSLNSLLKYAFFTALLLLKVSFATFFPYTNIFIPPL